MRDIIDVTILMDCSGSMQSIKTDMEGALEALIEEQKQYDDVVVSYYRFNSPGKFEEVFTNKSIKDVNKFELKPTGQTALIDAWCEAMDRTGARLSAINEADRPSKVLFVVITDGEENASREYTKQQLEEKVKTQEGTYNWKFLYLGANQVASDVAKGYGTKVARTMAYTANTDGMNAIRAFSVSALAAIRENAWAAEDASQSAVLKQETKKKK